MVVYTCRKTGRSGLIAKGVSYKAKRPVIPDVCFLIYLHTMPNVVIFDIAS